MTNAFTGTFDGQEHSVANMNTVVASASEVYVGLFGFVSVGTIKNVSVSGTASAVGGSDPSAGGIAGGIMGGTQSDDNVDPNHPANIENCFSSVTVSTEHISNDYGSTYAGGLVGLLINTNIINCANTGMVSASSSCSNSRAYAGGLAGVCSGKLDDCINNSYNTPAQ